MRSSGGAAGKNQSLDSLIQAMRKSIASSNGQGGNGAGSDDFHAGEGNSSPGYTDNNNPALLKWQNQTDGKKVVRYLNRLINTQTPAQDAEGYRYHQSPFQNMVIDQNLNAPAYAKLSSSDFDAYCKANNLTPIYRGWSGAESRDRFMNAATSHTGTGVFGEGYYFGDKITAQSYAGPRGAMTAAALSPNARVVDHQVLKNMLQHSRLKGQFKRSGVTPGPYMNNHGEAQAALKRGYNVIRTPWSYVVLTRDALVVREV